MKFLILISAACVICAIADPQNKLNLENDKSNKLNLQQVEQMLQQIENDEAKLKPVVSQQEDPTVSIALQNLFTQFRQLTSAYIDVLNAVNKNLGLPKYPKLPGLTRRRRGIMDTPPIKQIYENLSQLGNSMQEVGQLVTRVVSSVSEDSRKTVLEQFRRFTDLWSSQLNEISRMFERSIEGRYEQETVLQQINRHLSQLGRDIQRYVDNLLTDIRNRVVGDSRYHP